jgi:hypothetical protein
MYHDRREIIKTVLAIIKPAILIMTFTVFKSPVILAGMPVSSHRDVKPQGDGNAKSSTYALSKLPSMALDFGIPAKMTAHIAIMRIAVIKQYRFKKAKS